MVLDPGVAGPGRSPARGVTSTGSPPGGHDQQRQPLQRQGVVADEPAQVRGGPHQQRVSVGRTTSHALNASRWRHGPVRRLPAPTGVCSGARHRRRGSSPSRPTRHPAVARPAPRSETPSSVCRPAVDVAGRRRGHHRCRRRAGRRDARLPRGPGRAGRHRPGTSSKSSKLVHGGLRYLATGDVPWSPRACASGTAPGAAPRTWSGRCRSSSPLRTCSTAHAQGGAARLRPLRPGRRVAHRTAAGPQAVTSSRVSTLRGAAGGYRYWDARTDDARLTLRRPGGPARRRAGRQPRRGRRCTPHPAAGSSGVDPSPTRSARRAGAAPDWVVAASGVWAARPGRAPGCRHRVTPGQGAHLVFRRGQTSPSPGGRLRLGGWTTGVGSSPSRGATRSTWAPTTCQTASLAAHASTRPTRTTSWGPSLPRSDPPHGCRRRRWLGRPAATGRRRPDRGPVAAPPRRRGPGRAGVGHRGQADHVAPDGRGRRRRAGTRRGLRLAAPDRRRCRSARRGSRRGGARTRPRRRGASASTRRALGRSTTVTATSRRRGRRAAAAAGEAEPWCRACPTCVVRSAGRSATSSRAPSTTSCSGGRGCRCDDAAAGGPGHRAGRRDPRRRAGHRRRTARQIADYRTAWPPSAAPCR